MKLPDDGSLDFMEVATTLDLQVVGDKANDDSDTRLNLFNAYINPVTTR